MTGSIQAREDQEIFLFLVFFYFRKIYQGHFHLL